MPTLTATVQICDIKVNQRFRFIRLEDADPTVEYVKIMPSHYRKAGSQFEGACCLPILSLSHGIRTVVQPS